MLTESFVCTTVSLTGADQVKPSTSTHGLFEHTLAPYSSLKSSYKQASTPRNCLALSTSHIFAAQDQKAVVHVYNREKGNLEARIPFNDRIRSLATLGGDDEEETGILVMGMEAGRITLWELATGRIVSTSAAHLQPVTHLAVDPTLNWIVTASADAVVHIWSSLDLLSGGPLSSAPGTSKGLQPARSFSEHRSPIIALTIGHGCYDSNFVISASEDKILYVWSLYSGDLLQTYLLNAAPLCVVLDPADRAVYSGHDDGSLSMIEFQVSSTSQRSDIAIQVSPKATWGLPGHDGETGSVNDLGVSYDGTTVLSCHVSGTVHSWDVGLGKWKSRVHIHDRPVSNIQMLRPSGLPLPRKGDIKLKEVTKPRFDGIGIKQASLPVTAQFSGKLEPLSKILKEQDISFANAISSHMIPDALIDEGIAAFSQSTTSYKELALVSANGSEAVSSPIVELEKRNGNLLSQLEEAVKGQRKAIKRCMEYEREEWLRRQEVDRKRERKKQRRLREMKIQEMERKRFMGEAVNGNGPDITMQVPQQDEDLSSDTSEITDTER